MFKESVVLITGGANGLGKVMAEMFLMEGAKVFITYRNSEIAAKQMKDEYGERLEIFQADASDYSIAQTAIMHCIESFGKIDILVNNAASAKDHSLLNHNYEDFDFTIKNILYPIFNYSKAVCSFFIERKGGKIINIGSINGRRGREGSLAYATSKSGIEGFTKTIAKELGQYNINCNVVAPGYIDTTGQKNTSELIKKLVLDECAIRRLSEPEAIGNLVLFLASDKADNITGQVYQVDCGQYI